MFLKTSRRPQWLSSIVGSAMCAASALAAALIFNRSSSNAFVPLIFLFVILLAAVRFGSVAGILGTITATLIFALFMFEPLLRLNIKSSVQKSNLNLDGYRRSRHLRAFRAPTRYRSRNKVAPPIQ